MAVKSQFSYKGVVALVISLVLIIVLYPVLKLVYKLVNRGATSADALANSIVLAPVKNKYGHYMRYSYIADTVVPSIYRAYNSGVTEDEETAIANLNSLTSAYEVQIASDVYKAKYNLSLKDDSEKYLSVGNLRFFPFQVDLGRVSDVVRDNWF